MKTGRDYKDVEQYIARIDEMLERKEKLLNRN